MKTTMMKQKCSLNRSLITLLSVGVFAVCGFNVTAQGKPNPSTEQSARLIIYRIPNLGNNVIVDVYLDGAPFGSVGYGQSLKKNLSPGRHVLSLEPTPDPKYRTPSDTTVDVQGGKTYVFTAVDNGSGGLALK